MFVTIWPPSTNRNDISASDFAQNIGDVILRFSAYKSSRCFEEFISFKFPSWNQHHWPLYICLVTVILFHLIHRLACFLSTNELIDVRTHSSASSWACVIRSEAFFFTGANSSAITIRRLFWLIKFIRLWENTFHNMRLHLLFSGGLRCYYASSSLLEVPKTKCVRPVIAKGSIETL